VSDLKHLEPSAMQYHRVSLDESEHGGEATFSVRILSGQKQIHLDGLMRSNTVGELKELLQATPESDNLPSNQQRLICKGRELKPDSHPVSSFGVEPECVIHLFKRPPPSVVAELVAAPTTAVQALPTADVVSDVEGSQRINRIQQHNASSAALHEAAKDVRIWCMILLFLSTMSAVDIFTYSAGNFSLGRTPLDAATRALHFVCDIVGMRVSILGINSARQWDNVALVQRYTFFLFNLMIATAIYQAMSVVDLTQQVEAALKRQNEENEEGRYTDDTDGHEDSGEDGDSGDESRDGSGNERMDDPASDTGGDDELKLGVDDINPNHVKLTREVVDAFSYQLWVFSFIVMICWISCVTRAFNFRFLLMQRRRLLDLGDEPSESRAQADPPSREDATTNPLHPIAATATLADPAAATATATVTATAVAMEEGAAEAVSGSRPAPPSSRAVTATGVELAAVEGRHGDPPRRSILTIDRARRV
jgi:hypothetical protein